MHDYLTTMFWWNVGKYGGILAFLGAGWLARQTWLPHRHDGYVAMSGYVHKCSRCDRLPDGTYRAGFYGMRETPPDNWLRLLANEAATAYAGAEPELCATCGGETGPDDANDRRHYDNEPCACPPHL